MGLSTHILDTAVGRPAAGITVTLAREASGAWLEVHIAHTDPDGRVRSLLPDAEPLRTATYRLRFHTAAYFVAQGLPTLYPYIDVTFAVTDVKQHHHIPLLLTANGYTTYRGT